MASDLFKTLKERGYIYQATHLDEIEKILSSDEKITFYLGIDPTADSLHIGHFFALMMFRYLQDAGHHGILVIGGATALVGDPSGKQDMRKMLTKEQVEHNVNEVKELASHFIKVDGNNPAKILSNAEWINSFNYVDFLRTVGIHFNVNKMLACDAYKKRLEEGGLTFLEMGYMLMQSYDFVYLNETYGCTFQIGGSDQWGNIVAGTDLSRKMKNLQGDEVTKDDLFGLTCPLLLTKDGKKMGKTENGALWVARDKTTAYDFYQYFYNVDDSDVEMLMKLFTRLDIDFIEKTIKNDIIEAKKIMAYEITKLVHGEIEADKVLATTKSLFQDGGADKNAPEFILSSSLITPELNISSLLLLTQMMPSKSEARRMITQGAVTFNSELVTDESLLVSELLLNLKSVLLKVGKKRFLKIVIKD